MFSNDVEPDKYEIGTVNHVPPSVISDVIANIAKIELSVFNDILKCPLIPDVLSSIVARKALISFAASSTSSMYSAEADDKVALLNLNFPVPGSAAVTVVSYV